MDFFDSVDADIFCLQEIKLSEGQIEWNKENYYSYWNYAEKKVIPVLRFFLRKSHSQ